MLSITAMVVALSASDINFAQTPLPGPAPEPAPVASSEAVVTTGTAAVSSQVQDQADIEADTTHDAQELAGVSRQDAECLAKIVHHEAANQTERVQLAVAHVVLNRMKSPTAAFPRSICAVALQRGQFFNVHAYRPFSDPRWATSQRIASRAIAGEGLDNAPGALFFHTAGHSSRVSRTRPRVARLGGLDFYR